ncbi:hypothetical protein M2132_000457 [Dysgonomonas sp. PH5-45]|uniref:DUF6984 family protein n=1 Tax=unclassified Dysgonomonas TaxID=2630389 RepID=UPI0024747435|nr:MULTISPECIES: hypothetical protein [unclassified Dysgonomonas]MDH6354135.1 hypothetical protein [Dysgonomonas sp. PH5-45]MDH6387014.1 hypothetical protein [Dysgonomonas sp. PH5-37]
MKNRRPTVQELSLIEFLVANAFVKIKDNWNGKLLVKPMSDGDMGSLCLCTDDRVSEEKRFFGKIASECKFVDKDGVVVIASLIIDTDGNLFELDIWKTNFEKLIEIPLTFEYLT